MASVLIVTEEDIKGGSLLPPLQEAGFVTSLVDGPSAIFEGSVEDTPDLVVLDSASLSPEEFEGVVDKCHELKVPVIILVAEGQALGYNYSLGAEDFIVEPVKPSELVVRVKQLLWRIRGKDSPEVIKVGDLRIDGASYEVTLAGRKVLLTYKEYQLLRLLASNPGRVYTRETLLQQVWDYDYFGGTRTVDVHVRRLRSKIEDAKHSFIETIWNVGYRFKLP